MRDPGQELVKRSHATVAPEAAVFDAEGSCAITGGSTIDGPTSAKVIRLPKRTI